jgi:cytochrome d ubiquinol oxidase subunit I
MMGFGGISALLGVAGLWFTRRKAWADETVPAVATGTGDGPRAPAPPRWLWTALIWTALFPVLGNSFGWIFTEMARQPWVVYGEMFTADAVSPNVGPALVWTSLIGLSLLYGALAVVEVGLTVRYIKAGPPPASIVPSDADGSGDHALVGATTDVEGWDGERPLTFAY